MSAVVDMCGLLPYEVLLADDIGELSYRGMCRWGRTWDRQDIWELSGRKRIYESNRWDVQVEDISELSVVLRRSWARAKCAALAAAGGSSSSPTGATGVPVMPSTAAAPLTAAVAPLPAHPLPSITVGGVTKLYLCQCAVDDEAASVLAEVTGPPSSPPWSPPFTSPPPPSLSTPCVLAEVKYPHDPRPTPVSRGGTDLRRLFLWPRRGRV